MRDSASTAAAALIQIMCMEASVNIIQQYNIIPKLNHMFAPNELISQLLKEKKVIITSCSPRMKCNPSIVIMEGLA